MPDRKNVLGSIDISIMLSATLGASPFSYSKSCSTFRIVAAKPQHKQAWGVYIYFKN
jgi:hypothetical protein